MIIDIIGWIGAIAFSVCAIPQALEAIKNKACYINKSFLYLWLIGEVFTLVYAINIKAAPLLLNYIINGISLSIILYYNKSPK
jgi:uncharacterized protein with PQ loop repeat